MNTAEQYFYERKGCPFCDRKSTVVLARTYYHETAEANKDLPNIEGLLFHCLSCGIAYSSHGCSLGEFSKFYQKSFRNLSFLNDSILQKLRKIYLKRILMGFHRSFSVARLLNVLSFDVFQPPVVLIKPKGLRILDIGCGFGEFMDIYKRLGNQVIGTEVIPELVSCVRSQGMECHLGAVEELPFEQRTFDVAILRAVYYRTQDPRSTMGYVKNILTPNGQLAMIDPCPSLDGVFYFFKKQFPQGHFYITDPERYLEMLCTTFGLSCLYSKQIYGRPIVALRKNKTLGNMIGALELFYSNLFQTRPYVLSYNLSVNP